MPLGAAHQPFDPRRDIVVKQAEIVLPALALPVDESARGAWIGTCENVIALGPSGTGKTHVALGLAARQQDDGGWPLSWEPPGETARAAWRGKWTLDALAALRAYGRV